MTSAEVALRVVLTFVVVVTAAHVGGWVFAAMRQPRVQGEILTGIVLGPSLIGRLAPDALTYLFAPEVVAWLHALSQVGLVLFMFCIGLELDFGQLRGQRHHAWLISQSSIIFPLMLGLALGAWLHPRLGEGTDAVGFSLFLGVAMAITAFPVLARILKETGLYRTRIGVLTMTCAAVDDVTAWCILAGIVGFVSASNPSEGVLMLAEAAVVVVIVCGLLKRWLARMSTIPMWLAVVLALATAGVTEQVGVHAVFGGFLVGASMPRSAQVARDIGDKLEAPLVTFLLPVFFILVGLATRVDLLDNLYLGVVTLLVVAVAVAGKCGGSILAARVVGESWRDAATIAVLMNTRGLTELVILSVGLELELITPTVFTIMVVMALTTTLMTTPLLSLLRPFSARAVATIDPRAVDQRAPTAPAGPVEFLRQRRTRRRTGAWSR